MSATEATFDPFAPLEPAGTPGLGTVIRKQGAEIWEPQIPAPGEPPEAKVVRHPKYGPAVARWVYRNASDQPLFAVYRFEFTNAAGEKAKEALPYSYGRRAWTTPGGKERDAVSWHFKRVSTPVPLYGLDRLAARPLAPVIVTEGEKAADAAERLFPDLVAVSSQGGSKAPERGDWSALDGRDVLICPDNDAVGLAYAHQVAREAHDAGAQSVRLAKIPAGWPEGWDIADELPGDVTMDALKHVLDGAEPLGAQEAAASQDDVPAEGLTDEAVDAEIERLSLLGAAHYARARKPAAQALRMGVGDLDKAIALQRYKRRQKAEAERRAAPEPNVDETVWPLGILSLPDGLYADAGGDSEPTWLSGPIEVLGRGRDAQGANWGLWLKWTDADSRIHTMPMMARMLVMQPGELEAALLERGLAVNVDLQARGQLRRALNEVRTGSRVTFADMPGWCTPAAGSGAFVRVDGEVFGNAAEKIVLKATPENAAAKTLRAGSLPEWQATVAAMAQGNPIPSFCICAAFVGPLIQPLGESSGGFHFFGRSKSGKTLALRMGLSVWGPTKKAGLLRDWRTTANALEGAAEESNDGILPLDEIHQAEPKDIAQAVYQLANESGKSRLDRGSQLKHRRTWRIIAVSTGEVDVATMVAKASNAPLPAGAEVRLPSIPLDDHEMWPALHGHASSFSLMADLQKALLRQHGSAITPFLTRLTENLALNDGSLDQAAHELREQFYTRLPAPADVQVKEVARRCSLVALAGEMAIEWGILPWKAGEAIKAASTILSWWLQRRGGAESTEESQHVKAVRSYLSEFSGARFVSLVEEDAGMGHVRWAERYPDRPIVSRSGWRRAAGEDAEEYLLDKDGWAKLCQTAGSDPVEVAKTLKAVGHLEPGDGKNLTKTVRLPNVGKIRVYVIKASIFATDDAEPVGDRA